MYARWLIRVKKERMLSNEAAAERMCAYCNRLFFGIGRTKDLSWTKWSFPVITDTASLKELDHYIQNAIRYVYWGSFSKKRYRTRYTDLKRMGYRSLVHSYYHSTQRPNAAADA